VTATNRSIPVLRGRMQATATPRPLLLLRTETVLYSTRFVIGAKFLRFHPSRLRPWFSFSRQLRFKTGIRTTSGVKKLTHSKQGSISVTFSSASTSRRSPRCPRRRRCARSRAEVVSCCFARGTPDALACLADPERNAHFQRKRGSAVVSHCYDGGSTPATSARLQTRATVARS
jgi:hypothetical protein